jgi:glycosyltransferase involved in cell wall biosynthesis
VIVPVYNGGQSFHSCLEALAATRYDPYEVIVVDDGSADDSAALARSYGYQVLHTEHPRSGPAAARNLGAGVATGQILFFVDADVVVRPDTLSQVVQAFVADPALDALFGSYDATPAAQNFLSQYKNLFHHYVHQHSNEEASTFWSGCGAMRQQVFLSHGGFDTQRYQRPCIEDIELGYRVTRAGGRIRLIKSLQVTHLKRWTVTSLLHSDILDRGIPWSRLLLRERVFANDLNLQTANRISVLAVYGLLIALIAGLALPEAWFAVLAAAIVLSVLNWSLYAWFATKRGWPFVLGVIFWHWLYYAYNGICFAAGLALHLSGRDTRRAPDRGPAVVKRQVSE